MSVFTFQLQLAFLKIEATISLYVMCRRLITNVLTGDDSDEERNTYGAQQQPTYVQETNYYQDSGPPMAPPLDADHGSVSSSDKEELQEAREDYENASASDKESARDEYEEQYEETYDD